MAQTRRMFLRRASGTVAVLSCPAILGSCKGGGDLIVDAGNTADYAEGDLVAIVGEGVAIGLDADGFYAVTTFCTHANCDMSEQGTIDGTTGFECACHGSTFDTNGAVTGGPANDDLEHYAIEIGGDGAITIDLGTVVGAGERA